MARKKEKTDKIDKKPARGTIERQFNPRGVKEFLLIACEDEKTEPNYFEQFKELFPDRTVHIELVDKGGTDSLGVVEAAIKAVEKFKEQRARIIKTEKIDYVWVVFDRDDAHLDDGKRKRFNEALAKAKEHEVEVAYSNEVFELWFLLHLEDVAPDIPIPRNDKGAYTLAKHNISLNTLIQKGFYDSDIGSNQSIYERLEKAIRRHTQYSNYIYVHKKEDISTEQSIDESTRKAIKAIKKHLKNQEDIIKVVQDIGDELKAIERAAILLEHHHNTPEIDANPSTKVHLLVRLIRGLLNQYKLGTKKVESV